MNRRRRWLVPFAAAAVASMLLAGCNSSGGAGGTGTASTELAANQVIRTDFADDMKVIDPGLTTDNISFRVLTNVEEGLTRLDLKGNVAPGIATSWDVSADGLHYTFHLRDAKWSDGKPVTAKDFEYAWKRVLDPKTAAQYAYIISDYVKDVKATDDKTLDVTLKVPVPYFLKLTAFPTYMPVRQDWIEKYGDQYGTSPDKAVYNGPFTVTAWNKGTSIVIKKNPDYWDANTVKLNEVDFSIVKDANTLTQMYDTHQLDMVYQVPGTQIAHYKGNPAMQTRPEAVTDYLIFNTKSKSVPALANQKVRQALSMAIDRQAYVTQVEKEFLPAYGYVPPTIHGKDGEFFRSTYGENFKTFKDVNTGESFKMSTWFNDGPSEKEKAKQLLQEGLKEAGVKNLSFTLLADDTTAAKRLAQTLQQMWKDVLGINVNLDTVTFQTRLERVKNHNYEVGNVLWSADYDDPMTFMNMFVTGGSFNDPQWSNPEYDRLIKDAESTNNQDQRMKDFTQAEKILMTEMPIAPIYYRMPYRLQPAWIHDVMWTPTGADEAFKWAYVTKH